VVLIAGEQVELVDPHALFSGQPVTIASQTICLLQVDGSGWMETLLKLALEASGYRCVTALVKGETAAVALAMEDTPLRDTRAPVVTLGRSCRRAKTMTSSRSVPRPAASAEPGVPRTAR
jgi:two-component system chemotaxis sensor kinase CheA